MKNFLKLEYGVLLLFFISLVYSHQLFSPWVLLIFWYPDIAFFGYLFGSKVGAIAYNLTHYFGTAVGLFAIATIFQIELLEYLSLIQLAHICFDRFLGYGLKYTKGFKYTHLGELK